jgi:hypothetical protein
MTEQQRSKILDVMHTLSCIRDGKVLNPGASAAACWQVLNEVLNAAEPTETPTQIATALGAGMHREFGYD